MNDDMWHVCTYSPTERHWVQGSVILSTGEQAPGDKRVVDEGF